MQQHQFIYTGYEGVLTKRDVVIEGPTGLGKTRALLASILPFLQANPNARVIYSSRTVTQICNVLGEINDILEQNPKKLKSSSATIHMGVKRLKESYTKCFSSSETSEKQNTNSTDCRNCKFFAQRKQTNFSLGSGTCVTVETLAQHAEKNCPAGIMDSATQQARIVVVPHSFLFDSYWIQKFFVNLDECVVVIDEAHNFLAEAANSPFLNIAFNKLKDKELSSLTDIIASQGISRLDNNYLIYELLIERGFRPLQRLEWYMQKNPQQASNKSFDIYWLIRKLFAATHGLFMQLQKALKACRIGDKFGDTEDRLAEDPSELIANLPTNFSSILDMLIQQFAEIIKQKRLIQTLLVTCESDKNADSILGNIASILQLLVSLQEIIKSPHQFFIRYDINALSIYALHPKIKVNMILGNSRCSLFTSATMSPVQDVANMLGRNTALQIKLGHVFPEKNYLHFFVAGINSSRKDDGNTIISLREQDTLEQLLHHALSAAQGRNIGIFCSNLNLVQYVAELLNRKTKTLNLEILGYIPSKLDTFSNTKRWLQNNYQRLSKELFGKVKNFSDDTLAELFMALGNTNKTSVLCAVQGGTLAEGVSYDGNAMEMVITLGLPYPSSAAEMQMSQIKQDYWNMFYEDGREKAEDLAYKQEAFRKLAQSIGRAHRSKRDKAVIIMVDERLLAIKNTSVSKKSNYELLSPWNAKKNLSLLQKPIQHFSENIIIEHLPKNDTLIIKEHIRKRLNASDKDFISFELMRNKIINFYDCIS